MLSRPTTPPSCPAVLALMPQPSASRFLGLLGCQRSHTARTERQAQNMVAHSTTQAHALQAHSPHSKARKRTSWGFAGRKTAAAAACGAAVAPSAGMGTAHPSSATITSCHPPTVPLPAVTRFWVPVQLTTQCPRYIRYFTNLLSMSSVHVQLYSAIREGGTVHPYRVIASEPRPLGCQSLSGITIRCISGQFESQRLHA